MSRHDAVKALNIYKRAGQQAENLADFYEYCKGLELARNFQFPTLRQPPPSFLATMEDYIKEAPQSGSVQKKLEYQEKEEEEQEEEEAEHSVQPEEPAEADNQKENSEGDQPLIEEEEEDQEKIEEEDAKPSFLIDTDDLLGLNEINPKAAEIEDRNALALAIYPPGHEAPGPSNILSLIETGGSGWELALVTPQNNNNNNNPRPAPNTKLAGGFDNLLLDSLYEDDSARRQIQLTNAGYGHGGIDTTAAPPNPFQMQQDPFAMSNNIAPPTNVQMAMQQQQQQQMTMMHQSPYNYTHPHDYHQNHHHHQFSAGPSPSNPFGDAFLALPPPPGSAGPQQNNHHHMLL